MAMATSTERSYLISLNLTVEDFDPFGLNTSLSVITHVFETIAVVFYPFVLFVITSRSPARMEYYKYILIVQSTATTTLNIMFIIGNPSIVFPFHILYNNGVIPCDAMMTKIIFLMTLMSISVMATMTFCQLIYRIMVTFDRNHLFYKLSRPKIFTCFIILGCFGVGIIIFLPLAVDPPSADIKSLEIDFPALSKIFKEYPAVIGYFPEHSGLIQLTIFTLFLVSIAVIPVVVFIFAIMTWRLKEMKKSLQKQTYKLHAVLCRALFVQTTLTLTLLIPFLMAFSVCLQFSLVEGNMLERLFVLSSSVYAVSVFICVLYFITPYRVYIEHLGRTFLLKPRETTGGGQNFQSTSRIFYIPRNRRSTF